MRTHIQRISLVAGAAVVLALVAAASAQETKYSEDQRLNMQSQINGKTGHAENAKINYRRYCAGCHGDYGDGEGENAQWLDPKPRNFTLGQFKCRSTPTGNVPAGVP